MASKSSNSTQRLFILFLLCLSPLLLLLTATFGRRPDYGPLRNGELRSTSGKPEWLHFIAEEYRGKRIRMGFVNMDDGVGEFGGLHGPSEVVSVRFDRVPDHRRWDELFPEWIDENQKWNAPSCPEIPMPRFEDYGELDVVVAKSPCGRPHAKGQGVRDVFRLQVNLVVANLTARSGWMNRDADKTVHVVFVGACGPMLEIFRCDDLVRDGGDFWVYRPNLRRLKQKVLMPVGSCQLAPPYTQPGKELWRRFEASKSTLQKLNYAIYKPKEAYVTILHSSEAYVCGAIALAQSILQTNSTRDLILLADDSISQNSLQGLTEAGWKIKLIDRIRSPHAKKGAYNEWNYSKLRLWQLTEYDKIIFIDADLIVLKNIDFFFLYPQISAVGNNGVFFNSGVMLIEPSNCMFETLMAKRLRLVSANGGDQGFLNEVFTWWHRWPSKLNHLKMFEFSKSQKHETPEDSFTIHYLGLKPWTCYRDYDCNWDVFDHQPFASDSAHEKWWQVYEAMPESLQKYCTLTKRMDSRLKRWRGKARNSNLANGHWKIKVKDPRQHQS